MMRRSAALLVGLLISGAAIGTRAEILELDQAVVLALATDATLAAADAAVDAAAAEGRAAASGRWPTLDLGAAWTANLKKSVLFLPPEMAAGLGGSSRIELGRDRSLQAGLNLAWNLWTSGRLSAAAAAAREGEDAARWQRELAADAVRFAVVRAYADALLAASRAEIARDAHAAAAEAERVVAEAFAAGRASRFEHMRSATELANREAPLLQARNEQAAAMLSLKRICGVPADADIVLTETSAAGAPPPSEAALLSAMESHSAELRSLENTVALRRQQARLAAAGRGPVVQLQGSYALQGEWDDGLLPGDDERSTSAGVGVAVSVPIFDGFAVSADVDRAAAALRIAEVRRDDALASRRLAVRTARLDLESALAAVAGRDDAVDLAEEAHRLALVRLENGLATVQERLDAELALTQARAQRASALHDCLVARAALALAVGTTADLAAVEEDGR
ncbi:TolC family protein [bacterium]|nr:TolC family protein [bacterium]